MKLKFLVSIIFFVFFNACNSMNALRKLGRVGARASLHRLVGYRNLSKIPKPPKHYRSNFCSKKDLKDLLRKYEENELDELAVKQIDFEISKNHDAYSTIVIPSDKVLNERFKNTRYYYSTLRDLFESISEKTLSYLQVVKEVESYIKSNRELIYDEAFEEWFFNHEKLCFYQTMLKDCDNSKEVLNEIHKIYHIVYEKNPRSI